MKKRKLFLVGLVFLGLFCTACGKKQETIPELRLGHAPHDHHSPLYIAAMNPDYFRENGGIYLKEVVFKKEYELVAANQTIARVLIDSSTGGNELIRKLNENIFDMSFGGVPAMLNFIDKGSKIHILAPANAEGAGLVMGVDLPVTTWPEFMDFVKASDTTIRIGYKAAVSVQSIIFETALRESGIPFSTSLDDQEAKVVLLNLNGAKNLIPALKDGLIDGFVIMQPFVALAEISEVGRAVAFLHDLPPEGKWEGSPCCALAGRDLFVRDNQKVSEALTTLILRANRLIGKQPGKSAEQIAQWLGTSKEVEILSIPTIKFMVDFDASWNSGVNFWVDSMIEAGKLDSKVKDAFLAGELEQLIYDKKLYEKSRAEM